MNESPVAAPEPQPVTEPVSPAAIFVVLTIDAGGEDAVRRMLSASSGLRRAVAFRIPGAALELIVGVGSQAWDRLFAGPRPAHLRPFPDVRGGAHRAPSTPGDLLVHVRAMSHDACFELAHRIVARLAGAVTVVDEAHGFRYLENRDLIGFVDGTENPTGRDAVVAAIVGDEDPRFAGGSYLHVQRYVHDLAAWEALPVAEQERAIGRTKPDDVEMDDATKPADSHVALTSIEDADGTALEIVRATMPYGRVGGESGTYFVAFSRNPAVTERMLRNMVLGTRHADHDRLLDFSTPVTGTAFFAPRVDFLENAENTENADAPPLSSHTGVVSKERILTEIRGFDGVLELAPQPGSEHPSISWGDHFFYYAPDGVVPTNRQPYATIVTKDYPGDTASGLDDPDRWRLNIHVGKALSAELVGAHGDADEVDHSGEDVFLPHPLYGAYGWVCVVNPGEATLDRALEALRDAHRDDRRRVERRGDNER